GLRVYRSDRGHVIVKQARDLLRDLFRNRTRARDGELLGPHADDDSGVRRRADRGDSEHVSAPRRNRGADRDGLVGRGNVVLHSAYAGDLGNTPGGNRRVSLFDSRKGPLAATGRYSSVCDAREMNFSIRAATSAYVLPSSAKASPLNFMGRYTVREEVSKNRL